MWKARNDKHLELLERNAGGTTSRKDGHHAKVALNLCIRYLCVLIYGKKEENFSLDSLVVL
jgi:hypothetical protein